MRCRFCRSSAHLFSPSAWPAFMARGLWFGARAHARWKLSGCSRQLPAPAWPSSSSIRFWRARWKPAASRSLPPMALAFWFRQSVFAKVGWPMLRGKWLQSGWQGASLVAITYVYFLIFAQFAFLQRVAILGVAGRHLTAVMAAMAAGGILLSLLTPRLILWP